MAEFPQRLQPGSRAPLGRAVVAAEAQAARRSLRRCLRLGVAADRRLGRGRELLGGKPSAPSDDGGRCRARGAAPTSSPDRRDLPVSSGIGRCRAAAAQLEYRARPGRGAARGRACPGGRRPAARAGLPALEPVGPAGGASRTRLSAGSAPAAVRSVACATGWCCWASRSSRARHYLYVSPSEPRAIRSNRCSACCAVACSIRCRRAPICSRRASASTP